MGVGVTFPRNDFSNFPCSNAQKKISCFQILSFSFPSFFNFKVIFQCFLSFQKIVLMIFSKKKRVCSVMIRSFGFFPSLISRFGPEHRKLKTVRNIDIDFASVKKN